jgi:hypothetical protein
LIFSINIADSYSQDLVDADLTLAEDQVNPDHRIADQRVADAPRDSSRDRRVTRLSEHEFEESLSIKDREIWEAGEVNGFQWFLGSAAGVFLGFGLGQLIQGRWESKGLFFAIGEVSTLSISVVATISLLEDSSSTKGQLAAVLGFISFGILRMWDMVDSIVAPYHHNRRYRTLEKRFKSQDARSARAFIMPVIYPSSEGGGGLLFTMTF